MVNEFDPCVIGFAESWPLEQSTQPNFMKFMQLQNL